MTRAALLLRNLRWHGAANAALALGCAAAAAALAGALLVGDSMRGSLRALTLDRLGGIDTALVSERFFTQELAAKLRAEPGLERVAPALLLRAAAVAENGHAPRANLLGVDEEFWKLFPHEGGTAGEPALRARQTLANAALAEKLGAGPGTEVTVTVAKPGSVHPEQTLGERREAPAPLVRKLGAVAPDRGAGRFALQPGTASPDNLYLPLADLAAAVERPGRANALLVGGAEPAAVAAALRKHATLADYGLRVFANAAGDAAWLESDRTALDDETLAGAAAAALRSGAGTTTVQAQLAVALAANGKSVPYSLVAGIGGVSPAPVPIPAAGTIVLNQWAADQLGTKPGDTVRLDFFVTLAGGGYALRTADFRAAAPAPLTGAALDRHFAPTFPGITDATDFRKWKAPFPFDNRRLRKQDDDYWTRYRTAPKAFVALADGQRLWGTRFGPASGVRFAVPAGTAAKDFVPRVEAALRAELRPERLGLTPWAAKAGDLAASTGSTPFDVLFLAFSFFLIASAALLVALLFRLALERRAAEAGLLLATGTPPAAVRRLFVDEGLLLAALGTAAGLATSFVYAKLLIAGLAGRWRGAVGGSFIDFHWTWRSLAIGGAAALAVAWLALWRGAAKLRTAAVPALLAPGFTFARLEAPRAAHRAAWLAALLLLAGTALPLLMPQGGPGVFFGAGAALLAGGLAALLAWLRRPGDAVAGGLFRLAIRNAGRYPARSATVAGLVAAASFLLVAVSAFRHGESSAPPRKDSRDGGFALLAETTAPLHYAVQPANAEALNLSPETAAALRGVASFGLRVRSGDDASCLNVYQPRNPMLLGAGSDLRQRGGFAFAQLAADATSAERENPWRLLERDLGNELPAFGDAETLEYIIKVPVGGTLDLPATGSGPTKLRIVGALAGSLFQGQLVVADEALVRRFPEVAGRRYFLFDTSGRGPDHHRELGRLLELDLADAGLEAQGTRQRLAQYHAVANTYIDTFQLLGAFGLALGTAGLAAVVARNVIERRRELAVLRAVGFPASALLRLIVAENVFLLAIGMAIGAAAALVAILPQLLGRQEAPDLRALALLLFAAFAVGSAAAWIAARQALRRPLLAALRSE